MTVDLNNKAPKLRLCMIITTPVESFAEAEILYDFIKNSYRLPPKAQITGNITKILDPCCFKKKESPE